MGREYVKFQMIDRKEILIFLFFIFLFGTITFLNNVPHFPMSDSLFGAEYGNIAASIVKGNDI